jgi:hypothetical protein
LKLTLACGSNINYIGEKESEKGIKKEEWEKNINS